MRGFALITGIGILIGIALFVIDQSFRFVSGMPVEINALFFKSILLYTLYSIPLSLVNSLFFNYLDRIDWKNRNKYRFLVGLSGSVILTLMTIFFIRVFHRTVIDQVSFETFFHTERLQFYFIALFITLIISLFFTHFIFIKSCRKTNLKSKK